ncbi:hypothetical protein NQ318_004912 [Aromia moschata]|uniref:Alpha 1,4-glycosyltransferase domain-containing protein n=1 Tax=Aromia moschata TaxID=1265417 RepID=A0AAV8Z0U2_9CUCU|nr:hypothetical protein NQ318_004912 [Aromia moschata]
MPTFFFHRTKLIVFLTCVILTTFLLANLHVNNISSQFYHYVYPKAGIHCFRIKTNSLPDITEVRPRKGKSIFFHETSCSSYYNGKISIAARQACAVESAAKMNPNLDVYLLYTSPGNFCYEDTQSDRILKALLSYENVNILHLDFEKYAKGTPVEELYERGLIENSAYPTSHASDVLRYLTLWKYGGIYLDLDVIVIKNLEHIPLNYAGLESDRNVAAGVLSFAPHGVGHHLAKTCLNDLKEHFNGHDWGNNGPGVITRLLRSICETDKVKEMSGKDCRGFMVYPPEKFYAIPWWNWTMFFNEASTDAVFRLSKDSHIIHVWNKHSRHIDISITSRLPYLLYAKKFCPKVIEQCDDFF